MSKHPVDRLVEIMATLRDPEQGCPWDKKQTYRSIVPHTLEEAYEVAEAIELEEYDHLKEELGDLLFQVIFYSRLAEEEARFNFDDVIETLNEKLIRRHPHVFQPQGKKNLADQEVRSNWETIKQQERQSRQPASTSKLDGVSINLPALSRAQKLQGRAAHFGFDWPSVQPALAKIDEETQELRDALQRGDQQHAVEELGDVIFSCVNVARHLNADSEQLLRQATQKFESRFRKIETMLDNQGRSVDDADLEELDQLWDLVKQQ